MKKIFFFFSIFLLIASVVFYNKIPTRNNNVAGAYVINLTVYEKISNDGFRELHFKKGETALELLKQTANIETKGEKESAFITGINGRAANEKNGEFWAFYLNGKLATVGAGSYKLQNNDKIEWVLEKF